MSKELIPVIIIAIGVILHYCGGTQASGPYAFGTFCYVVWRIILWIKDEC